MKKILLVLTAFMLSISLFGCSDTNSGKGSDDQNEKVKIAIVQPTEHTSLNQIRDVIVSQLKAKGFDESKAEIILKNANGDTSILPAIYNGLIAEGVDIIIPIATKTAQAAAAATSEIPIVFSAVSSPVEAGLIEAFDKTDKNITGVSDSIAVEKIFQLANELTPDAKTFGFVYNTSEINSTSCIARAKAYCDDNGLTYEEAAITSTADLQQAVASIANSVDAFFTPDDNTVASAMTTYVQVATDAGIPIYVGADSMVIDGGLGTVGIDYTVLGKQTADMAIKILNGTSISDIPAEIVKDYAKIINIDTADALKITISEKMKSEFKIVGNK